MVILSGIISPHIFDKHTINPNNNAILTKLFFSVLIRKIISFSYQKNTRKTATFFALALCKATKPLFVAVVELVETTRTNNER